MLSYGQIQDIAKSGIKHKAVVKYHKVALTFSWLIDRIHLRSHSSRPMKHCNLPDITGFHWLSIEHGFICEILSSSNLYYRCLRNIFLIPLIGAGRSSTWTGPHFASFFLPLQLHIFVLYLRFYEVNINKTDKFHSQQQLQTQMHM